MNARVPQRTLALPLTKQRSCNISRRWPLPKTTFVNVGVAVIRILEAASVRERRVIQVLR